MLKRFYPDCYVKSIYDIDLNDLKADGIKGLILDLDNTIIARNSSIAPAELRNWVKKLYKAGFKACIVSNNWKTRVSSIASQVELPLVARAAKPRTGAFKRAMYVLGTDRSETAVIGDQVFTDVFGGNLAGLYTVLVVPMSNHEAFHTKILRRFEKRIMKRWLSMNGKHR
ncbi:MAG TPA: YqeG family HAD IIIA-type phosphatase [Anaerolineae bacterium]|nr:YqeG family HAD IIIA-type phosphatase [Anaerolineae bacterium]